VLEILNITENSEQSLNITNNSEKSLNRVWTFWKFWTLLKILKKSEQSENSEQILNRVWTLLNILDIVWTESEQCLNTHFLHYYSTCDKLIVIKGLINTIRMFFFHVNFIFFLLEI
jgi:hypothetical protein